MIRIQTNAYTGADISAVPSADGAIFLSFQAAGRQRVIRYVNGITEPVPLERDVSGRGTLAVFGSDLKLIAWNEDEGKSRGICYILDVPGYVAPLTEPTPPPTPGSVIPEPAAELPNYGRPYASGVEVFGNGTLTIASSWADFLRLGMFVLRINKLVAAVAQMQRFARQVGWIKD